MNDPVLYWQCRALADWCAWKMRKHKRTCCSSPKPCSTCDDYEYPTEEWPVWSVARALAELASRYRLIPAPLRPLDEDVREASHVCQCLYDGVRPAYVAQIIQTYLVDGQP